MTHHQPILGVGHQQAMQAVADVRGYLDEAEPNLRRLMRCVAGDAGHDAVDRLRAALDASGHSGDTALADALRALWEMIAALPTDVEPVAADPEGRVPDLDAALCWHIAQLYDLERAVLRAQDILSPSVSTL